MGFACGLLRLINAAPMELGKIVCNRFAINMALRWSLQTPLVQNNSAQSRYLVSYETKFR
jgi:hypothetical protein